MNEKIAIVTGASSGIGRATAALLARKGVTVVAVGRNQKDLNSIRDGHKAKTGQIKVQLGDVTEPSQLDRIIAETVETFGQIDILVNSAGIIKSGNIETTTPDEWDRMMNINVRSVFDLIQRCVPYLVATKGNIVNVSSVAGTRSFPGILSYCVSKAAVDQMTRCIALELADRGVRVNAVNPGVVVTNLHKRSGMDDEAYKKFLQHARETHPIGRPGTAAEVAELIYFLSSDKAGWITGATYEIDGGRGQTCAR